MRQLEIQVQKHFATLPSQYKYEIYNIAEKPEKFASLTPDLPSSKLQHTHCLLFVTGSQKQTNNDNSDKENNDNDNESMFLSGIEVYEYLKKEQPFIKTVYISKIDTTGSSLSRGVTRRLVQAYIGTLTEQTKMDPFIKTCYIHTFARSQPQYLFTNSAKNQNKSILNDRQLVGWWKMTFNQNNNNISSSSSPLLDENGLNIKKYWMIPGVDDEYTALLDIKQKISSPSSSSTVEPNQWKYGYPYDPKASAIKVIPRFEDDGKSRYIKSLINDEGNDKITVEEFWMMFGYSEECGSGKLTGVFVIEINNTSHINKDQQSIQDKKEMKEEEEHVFNNDQYTEIWNELLGLEFYNDQENKKSTSQFLKRFEKELKDYTIKITTNNGVEDTQKKIESSLANQTINVLSPKRKEPQCNVLIPKRRKNN
ncbi:unnamed protein product [Cunninghamella blakesleeana]